MRHTLRTYLATSNRRDLAARTPEMAAARQELLLANLPDAAYWAGVADQSRKLALHELEFVGLYDEWNRVAERVDQDWADRQTWFDMARRWRSLSGLLSERRIHGRPVTLAELEQAFGLPNDQAADSESAA